MYKLYKLFLEPDSSGHALIGEASKQKPLQQHGQSHYGLIPGHRTIKGMIRPLQFHIWPLFVWRWTVTISGQINGSLIIGRGQCRNSVIKNDVVHRQRYEYFGFRRAICIIFAVNMWQHWCKFYWNLWMTKYWWELYWLRFYFSICKHGKDVLLNIRTYT